MTLSECSCCLRSDKLPHLILTERTGLWVWEFWTPLDHLACGGPRSHTQISPWASSHASIFQTWLDTIRIAAWLGCTPSSGEEMAKFSEKWGLPPCCLYDEFILPSNYQTNCGSRFSLRELAIQVPARIWHNKLIFFLNTRINFLGMFNLGSSSPRSTVLFLWTLLKLPNNTLAGLLMLVSFVNGATLLLSKWGWLNRRFVIVWVWERVPPWDTALVFVHLQQVSGKRYHFRHLENPETRAVLWGHKENLSPKSAPFSSLPVPGFPLLSLEP